MNLDLNSFSVKKEEYRLLMEIVFSVQHGAIDNARDRAADWIVDYHLPKVEKVLGELAR